MTIDYVREFIVLAKIKNYLIASDTLFISQASLSRHIMALEEEIGTQLFSRTTRSMELTEAGFRFLPYAYRLIELEDAGLDSIKAQRKRSHSLLTVGTFNSIRVYGITQRFGRFAQSRPDIHLEDAEGGTQTQIRNILTGKYNLAFVMETEEMISDRLSRIRVATDTMVAVIPESHPLAGRQSVALEELSGETFLMPGKGRTLRNIYFSACRQAGFEPKLLNMSLSGHTAVDLVRYQFCVMLKYRKDVESMDLRGVALLNIDPLQQLQIDLIYNENNLSAVERDFLQFIEAGGVYDEGQ